MTAAALVFALLNCFLGIPATEIIGLCSSAFLRDPLSVWRSAYICGFPLRWSLLAALAAGIFCALLGYLLYRAGLFYPVLGSHCIPPAAASPSASTAALAACLIAAPRRRRLCSGPGAGDQSLWSLPSAEVLVLLFFCCPLAGQDSPLLTILLTAILAFLGILVQLKPWKNKEYWEQEDQNLQRENREQARRRKSRKKQKRKEKKAKRKNRRRKRREPETKTAAENSCPKGAETGAFPFPAREYACGFQRTACVFPAFSGAAARSRFPESFRENSFSDIQLQLFQRSLGKFIRNSSPPRKTAQALIE